MTKVVHAPGHLKQKTQVWFRKVAREYELQDHHLRLLQLACEAWELAQEARAILLKEKLTYISKAGEPRAHPAVAIERDSMVTFARLLRELNLSEETPGSRPPGIRY